MARDRDHRGFGPPTDFARVLLYCELVDAYDVLCEEFVGGEHEERSFDLDPGIPLSSRVRWSRVVRAMALRKFLQAPRDQVYVPTVLDAIVRCTDDAEVLSGVGHFRQQFQSIATVLRVDEGSGRNRVAEEVVRDLLYGGLLHGDFDKWKRVSARAGMTTDLMTFIWVDDGSHFIKRLRAATRIAIESGQVRSMA